MVALAGIVFSALIPGLAAAQEKVVGAWHGTLEPPGASLPVVFHVRGTPGSLTATLDSPSQGAVGIPVSRVVWEEGKVELEVAAAGGLFAGEVQADGKVVGRWSQGGANLDLVLEHRVEPTAEETEGSEGPGEPDSFALSDAVLARDVARARALIEGGADIHALDRRPNVAGGNGRRPLNFAALNNDVAMIELLLDLGADINQANLSGYTPLHHAVEAQSAEAIALLVSRGADITLKNKRGLTPEEFAARANLTRAAAALAEATGRLPVADRPVP
jgi:hypothetical protein